MATIYYAFANGIGVPIFPFRNMPDYDVLTTGGTLNTTGDIVILVGRISLQNGFIGGSKTLSAAGGGSIYCRPVATSFSNAGTLLRIGLQDMTSGGDQDGTFDVYADLVGGTDVLPSSSTIYNLPMEVGSKTVSHGDYITVVFEMISRGGSDQVSIHGLSSSSQATPDQIPYSIRNSVRDRIVPYCALKFDDGSIGWFSTNVLGVISTTNFNLSSSAADEIGSMFKLPFSCKVQHLYASMNAFNTPATFEAVIYSDPLGTPSVLDAVSFDAAKLYNATTRGVDIPLTQLIELQQNVNYAVTLRPTNNTSIGIEVLSFGGDAALKGQTELGADWSYISRLNNTGPFTVDITRVSHIGLYATEIGLTGDIVQLFT